MSRRKRAMVNRIERGEIVDEDVVCSVCGQELRGPVRIMKEQGRVFFCSWECYYGKSV